MYEKIIKQEWDDDDGDNTNGEPEYIVSL